MSKLINATDIRNGTVIMIEKEPCTVKSFDASTTGKHGHAKIKIEAIGIFNNKKKVFVVPGHERFEVPEINKSRGQVLSAGEKISIMDLESFETLDVDIEKDIKEELEEGDNVEYWEVEGRKIIKRKL